MASTFSNIKWDDLKIVLSVAEQGSLTGAAAYLDTTESTVSRRLSSIENQLGLRLFERMPTGMNPTTACSTMLKHLSLAESEIERSINAARESTLSVSGVVHLTSVPIVANHIIIPNLNILTSAFPDVSLDLISTQDDISVLNRECDIAVRISRPNKELDAMTKQIGKIKYAAYIHELLLPNEKQVPWLSYERNSSKRVQARWIINRVEQFHEARTQLSINDNEAAVEAIKSKLGKSLLPTCIGNKVAGLVQVPYPNLPEREVWILFHPDLKDAKRIRAVIDWLVDTFSKI
ncbi:DNA-binding transcriptional LysR family regulator [Reinekea marinisedimentorum]|uniref:DNA-binding transcriptional LysR family regulator n=1 Tax=Reinekea marinisedimentorum TaxID=230495 RepID=A0A4R3I5B8_9GAMM|nr:DNA-binding transcriptional LysR family regulator [Reinekea marinisedimentorum]